LFTAHSLARQLNWVHENPAKGNPFQPSNRFNAAFDVLTKLILPGAASPTELEGLNQRDSIAVAEGAGEAAATVAKQRVHSLSAWV
jgi:hypothetical protein